MEERARRLLHEVAMLLEDMAKEDLKLLQQISVIDAAQTANHPGRERIRKKLEAIRDNANRIRKETRR